MSVIETSPDPAAIALSAPVNLRDLGGTPIPGGVLRRGVAVRADDLSTITPDVADALVDDGLRAVIDLRSVDEVAITGRGPLGTRASVTYHHIPFLADLGQAMDEAALDQRTFGRMYLRLYEGAAAQIVTSLAIIAHAPGTVAFHCAAGQDRTGVLAAALLLALGADRDAIVADYVRTGANSAAIMRRIAPTMAPLLRRHGLELDAGARAALRTEFSETPMRTLLDVLDERHGDPLEPLRAAGLTDALIARLRDRALTRATG